MKKILRIAGWEIAEKIKVKSFWVFMVLFPLFVFLAGLIPAASSNISDDSVRFIGVLDFTGKYFAKLTPALENQFHNGKNKTLIMLNLMNRNDEKAGFRTAENKISSGEIIGYIIIHDIEGQIHTALRTSRIFEDKLKAVVYNTMKDLVLKENLKMNGVDEDVLKSSDENFSYQIILTKDFEDNILKVFMKSYFFLMLLIMMILFSGGQLVRTMVEEKSNRIIEILLTSCSMKELLAGKIIGMSFLGLFQLFIWIVIGTVFLQADFIGPDVKWLHIQLLYFLLTYILYSSVFIGFGSFITNDQDAQQLNTILSMVLIIPLFSSILILRNPDSVLSLILTYFPFTSGPVILLRLNSNPPDLYEVVVSTAILLTTIVLMINFAARLFKDGIVSNEKISFLKILFARSKQL